MVPVDQVYIPEILNLCQTNTIIILRANYLIDLHIIVVIVALLVVKLELIH